MRNRSMAIAGLVLAVVMAMPASATAVEPEHQVYGPNAQPRGVTYEGWTRRFARYLFEPPVAESPIVNPNCDAIARRGGVLFMPVATSEGIVLHCDVPYGVPFLVSPGGAFATLGLDADTPKGTRQITDDQLAAIHDVVVKVDGERIPRINRFKTASWVRLDLGSDNLFGVDAGQYRMYLGGWFLVVRAFDPGRHVIWLGDVFTDQTHTDQVATIKFVLNVH